MSGLRCPKGHVMYIVPGRYYSETHVDVTPELAEDIRRADYDRAALSKANAAKWKP